MTLLGTNLDLLGSIISIVESYFLLDAQYILKVNNAYVFLLYQINP